MTTKQSRICVHHYFLFLKATITQQQISATLNYFRYPNQKLLRKKKSVSELYQKVKKEKEGLASLGL